MYRSEFLDFMVRCGALLFGDYTLKSGRKSPYFINTGEYKTGLQLSRLGDFYAKLIHNSVCPQDKAGKVGEELDASEQSSINDLISAKFNVLYGPAYKGIPLVTATSVKLAESGTNLKASYNRKERKDHGEGDLIMGYRPMAGDRIAIIEDVTSAGTSVRETVALLGDLGIEADVVALYISVDRMERGTGNTPAIAQLKEEYGIEVHSIATIEDIIDYLEDTPPGCAQVPDAQRHAAGIRKYLELYGESARKSR